jgi:hypothetical protein
LAENEIANFTHIETVEKFFESANIGGMKNKPLLFTVLSILCFIEPLIKVLYFKAMTKFDFVVIFANLQARNTFVEVVDFWLIFPMAGLLITRLRKWTYFMFMGVLAYINYNIFTYEKYTWPYNSDTPFMYNYVIAICSLAAFAYFLSPKAREPFFEKRARLWEVKTRYNVQISCKLQSSNLTFPNMIMNISQTGVFVQESKYMNHGDMLQIEFNFLGQTISLPVQVMNKHKSNGVMGYGLQFKFSSFRQSVMMGKIMKVLKKSQSEFKKEENLKFAA